MAQTYTLEEAAQRLGLSQEDFKRRIKDEWKSVRSFRDGPTLRYRASDIDELARMLGEASDPGLQLGPVGSGGSEHEVTDASDHFNFDEDGSTEADAEAPPAARSGIKSKSEDMPLLLDSDEGPSLDFDPPSSSAKIAKTGADSNVRVDGPSGSGRIGEKSQQTDEIDLDLSGPRSAIIRPSSSSPKLSSGMSGTNLAGPKSKISGPPSGKIPGPTSGSVNPEDGSSEFELSLDADSDSFELKLGNDSDEAEIGLDLSPPPGTDRGGLSGINLGKPADSGISLERPSGMIKGGGSKPTHRDDSALDFDLSIDPTDVDVTGPKTSIQRAPKSSGTPKSSAPSSGGPRTGGPKSTRRSIDSDSEFELTLDDNSGVMENLSEDLQGPKTSSGDSNQGDIFETDFDLPVVNEDSESEVVAVDDDNFNQIETSDFDLAISDADAPIDDDESASEVVLVDDDMPMEDDGGVLIDDEDMIVSDQQLDDSPSASKALRNVPRDDYEYEEEDEVEDSRRPVRTVAAAPAPWGPLPALVLFPCLVLVFLGSLMSFELLRSMWGYQQPNPPGNVIVRGMADTFGFETKE